MFRGLRDGLPYVREGVLDAIAAGKSGDPFAISIASLSIFSGFLTMAGPLAGPVGPLISALSGLLSAILGQFLPADKSLIARTLGFRVRLLREKHSGQQYERRTFFKRWFLPFADNFAARSDHSVQKLRSASARRTKKHKRRRRASCVYFAS